MEKYPEAWSQNKMIIEIVKDSYPEGEHTLTFEPAVKIGDRYLRNVWVLWSKLSDREKSRSRAS